MPTFYNIIHLVITFTGSNIIIITIILSLLIPIQPAWHCIILVPIPTDTHTSTYLPYIPRLYKNTYAHVNNYTQLCIPDAFRNSLCLKYSLHVFRKLSFLYTCMYVPIYIQPYAFIRRQNVFEAWTNSMFIYTRFRSQCWLFIALVLAGRGLSVHDFVDVACVELPLFSG